MSDHKQFYFKIFELAWVARDHAGYEIYLRTMNPEVYATNGYGTRNPQLTDQRFWRWATLDMARKQIDSVQLNSIIIRFITDSERKIQQSKLYHQSPCFSSMPSGFVGNVTSASQV